MNNLELHAARDFVQARLVGALFTNALRGQIALKGGLAMRVLAGSVRYTDDIDLAANPSMPLKAVEACVKKAVNDIKASGLMQDVSLTDPKQTDVTQKWKVKGRIGGHDISLKVEVSRRNPVSSDVMEMASYTPNADSGPIVIGCVNLPTLAAAKVDCLANPKREAPRDIYDLFLLIRMDVKPTPETIASYGAERLMAIRDMVWDKMEKMDYAVAREKLLGFLPAAEASRLTAEVWDEMRLEVNYRVCEWVDAALEGASGTMTGEERNEQELAATPA